VSTVCRVCENPVITITSKIKIRMALIFILFFRVTKDISPIY